MAFSEEFGEFLDPQEFATSAIYNAVTAIAGIFVNAYAEAALGLAGLQATVPLFVCVAADVDADPTGKTLLIGTTTYTVMRGEPDGTGMTRLVLRKP